jgi:hypothetical protein
LIVLELLYVQRTRNTSAVIAVRALCSFVSHLEKSFALRKTFVSRNSRSDCDIATSE